MERNSQNRSDSQPLLIGMALAAAVLSIILRLLPPDIRPWNLSPVGAMLLLVGARARIWHLWLIPLTAIIGLDLYFYVSNYGAPEASAYVGWIIYLFLGLGLLRRTENPIWIGGAAMLGTLQFFVVTNFGSWLEQSLPYGYTLAGLVECYAMGLEFAFRNSVSLLSDLVFSGIFFGLFAWLSRAYFVDEQVYVLARTEENR